MAQQRGEGGHVDHTAEALELPQIQAPTEVIRASERVKGGKAVEDLDAMV